MHQLDKVLADGEAETCAAKATSGRAVGLREWLE